VAGFSPQVLPIVALTATTYPEDIRAALDAGMQDHVAKPIAFERLRQVASRWALHEVPPETPQSRPSGMAITADERLVTMWMQTRARALSQVETFLAGDGGEIARDELARQMHLFTGTAAQFGEGELGHRAAELEAALRHEAPQRQVRQLALVMLERAAPC
jgi:CheY-like chemotaxis protein